MSPRTILVGDVGGTHARFAIAQAAHAGTGWRLHDRLDFEGGLDSLTQALGEYFARAGVREIPAVAVIAVAGPVHDGRVTFTNRHLEVSEQELKGTFSAALLINDFAALAFAAEALDVADVCTIGPEIAGLDDAPISVLGAGTGFGVACLARSPGHAIPMATEGGHIAFAPGDDQEIELLRLLARRHGRVSVERVLSGPGLESLYRDLAQICGRQVAVLSAAQIVQHASGGDADCRAALMRFCSIYGAVAGDFALAHGARGGVFIAGGVSQKIEAFVSQGTFRARFESKGRMSALMKSIPTRLIRNPDAALLGAARAGLALH